jgi:hypothetical protein
MVSLVRPAAIRFVSYAAQTMLFDEHREWSHSRRYARITPVQDTARNEGCEKLEVFISYGEHPKDVGMNGLRN